MDIDLGQFNLTENQKKNIVTLAIEPISGFGISHSGEVIATASRELSQLEIDALKSSISGLPDILSKDSAVIGFDEKLAKRRLYEVFSNRVTLMIQYAGLMMGLLEFKNFSGLKDLSNSVLTGNDLSDFKSVFQEQGINLDDF